MLHSAPKTLLSMMEFDVFHARINSILILKNARQLQLERSMTIIFMAMWFHKHQSKLILKPKMSYQRPLFFLIVQQPIVMPRIHTMTVSLVFTAKLPSFFLIIHSENVFYAILSRYITVQLFSVKLGRYFIFLPISIIY
jgi:hypothetical protein